MTRTLHYGAIGSGLDSLYRVLEVGRPRGSYCDMAYAVDWITGRGRWVFLLELFPVQFEPVRPVSAVSPK